jgi:uncharacterized protein
MVIYTLWNMEKLLQMKILIFIVLTTLLTMTGQVAGQGDLMKDLNEKNRSLHPKQANHLIHEKSPYLLQHAYNPVDWYPWGDEALAKAAKEDKPIFLSIGYSTCHWCHVMAHESFEDQEIANFLNTHFVSIKVDREERPGIDQIYMAATQAMTGSGGWPMSLFLFPDAKPFYAGTYFPPRAGFGRPGFMEILQAIQKAWVTDRKSLSVSAEQITAHIRRVSPDSSKSLEKGWLDKGFSQIEESYEPEYGGFAQAPKFPRPVVMDFLLRHYKATGKKEARDMALFTLEQMAAGGMYDQIGGGFHRYSVDARWRVPHFEKMLYDQSQLVFSYLSAFQLTTGQGYRKTAIEILEYVLRDMQDPGGGFYSAEDADSVNPYNPAEHSEGAFYLWTEEEIDTLLTGSQASLFKAYFGVKKNGNALHDPQKEFTGRNILYQEKDFSEAARTTKLSEQEAEELLQDAREKLLNRRQDRTAPHLDDKIITAWNGLMISAFARAAMILEEDRYLTAANRAADFLLNNLKVNGELVRRWREGEARYSAGLDDYSFLIQGLLDLYAASHDPARLRTAMELTEKMIELFGDEKGGFYDTPESAKLLTRMKAAYDGAEPSGNSVAAMNLLRLAGLTGKKQWAELATKCIESFGKTLASYPLAMPLMLSAMDFQMDKPRQIVIAGERNNSDTRNLLREVHSRYLPNTVLLLADGGENQKFLEERLPFIATVKKINGRATAYVCEDFTCRMPVNTREALSALLDGKKQPGS